MDLIGAQGAFLLAVRQDIVPQIQRLAFGKRRLIRREFPQFLIGHHDGNLRVAGEVDAVFQLDQLAHMMQKLVRVLIIEPLVDGNEIDNLILEACLVVVAFHNALEAFIGYVATNAVFVVRAEDEYAMAVIMGGIVRQHCVSHRAATREEVEDGAVRLGRDGEDAIHEAHGLGRGKRGHVAEDFAGFFFLLVCMAGLFKRPEVGGKSPTDIVQIGFSCNSTFSAFLFRLL